jgi:hypothetical protein
VEHEEQMSAVDLAKIWATSDRLYKADFLGRSYLADYVADVGMLCKELESLRVKVRELEITADNSRQLLDMAVGYLKNHDCQTEKSKAP